MSTHTTIEHTWGYVYPTPSLRCAICTDPRVKPCTHNQMLDSCVCCLRREVKALSQERERWRHNVQVEGDYVCPDSLAMSAYKAVLEEIEERTRPNGDMADAPVNELARSVLTPPILAACGKDTGGEPCGCILCDP